MDLVVYWRLFGKIQTRSFNRTGCLIETLEYKCPVNNKKQDSERATQNIFGGLKPFLMWVKTQGKVNFVSVQALFKDTFGVKSVWSNIYVFCLFNLGFCLIHRMDVAQFSPIPLKLSKLSSREGYWRYLF